MAGTGKAHLRDNGDVLLRVEDLVVEFPVGRTGLKVHAVSGISFDVLRGETLGLVGETGCGKSTTGRAIMMLPRPQRLGRVRGTRAHRAARRRHARARTRMQMIFQDPISSLNPWRKVRDIVLEPLAIWKRGTKEEQLQESTSCLKTSASTPPCRRKPGTPVFRRPVPAHLHRSLVGLDPTLIICDEPVSALDVSVQAQVLNLLEDLKVKYGLTPVFIAHDLAVVKNISDRVP